MPDNGSKHQGNLRRVICETVAFLYQDGQGVPVSGEAEIVIVLSGSQSEPGVNMQSVRVDILSAFNSEGQDIFLQIMSDSALRLRVEQVALEHYLCPPKLPVELPGRMEW